MVHVLRKMVKGAHGLQKVAAAAIVVGLASGCATRAYVGDPAAPITVNETAFGYEYSQSGYKLEGPGLGRLLKQGGANVTGDLRGRGAVLALGTIAGGIGGALIGFPIGNALGGGRNPPMFLVPVGMGTSIVALAIGRRSDARVHHAVLMHNAHHGKGDPSQIPPLHPLRSAWLLRSVTSGGYTAVDETMPSVGAAGYLSVMGPSASYDWSLGYFVTPQLALSGNVLAVTQVTDLVRSGGARPTDHGQVFLHYSAALANATYYFSPNFGLYAFAGAGYGIESSERGRAMVDPNASGLALSGGVGWDFTVGQAGALGLVARGLYSPLEGDFVRWADGKAQQTPYTDRWSGVMLGLSLTYF